MAVPCVAHKPAGNSLISEDGCFLQSPSTISAHLGFVHKCQLSDDHHQMVPSALLVHQQAPAKCHYWQLCQLIPSALSACRDPAPAYTAAWALESDLIEFPRSQVSASCRCQVHGRNNIYARFFLERVCGLDCVGGRWGMLSGVASLEILFWEGNQNPHKVWNPREKMLNWTGIGLYRKSVVSTMERQTRTVS